MPRAAPLSSDDRAASEIVGAMMLVLIVVAAATSFSTFVLAKQDEIQEAERVRFLREQEQFAFTLIDTTPGSDPTRLDEIRYTVRPLFDQDYVVRSASINGIPLKAYDLSFVLEGRDVRVVTDAKTYPYQDDPTSLDLIEHGFSVQANEQLTFVVNLRTGGGQVPGQDHDPLLGSDDFFSTTPDLDMTQPISFSFMTGYLNEVTKVLTPPRAVATVHVDCGDAGIDTDEKFVLRANGSHHAEADRYLVTWAWSGTYDPQEGASGPLYDDGDAGNGVPDEELGIVHEYLIGDTPYDDGGDPTTYDITLRVVDDLGMQDEKVLHLMHPGC